MCQRIIVSPLKYSKIIKGGNPKTGNLQYLLYQYNTKSRYGPYGFGMDDVSSNFMDKLLNNSVWWNIEKLEYCQVNNPLIKNNLYLPGIFFFDATEIVLEELDKTISLINRKKKNELLKRYNKPPLEIEETLFTLLYDPSTNSYDGNILNHFIVINQGFCIWNNDINYGRHFIFYDNRNVINKIANIASNLTIKIEKMDDINLLPSW